MVDVLEKVTRVIHLELIRIIFFFEIFLNSLFLFISGVFVSQIDAIDDTGTAPTRVCEISIHNYKHTVFKKLLH